MWMIDYEEIEIDPLRTCLHILLYFHISILQLSKWRKAMKDKLKLLTKIALGSKLIFQETTNKLVSNGYTRQH